VLNQLGRSLSLDVLVLGKKLDTVAKLLKLDVFWEERIDVFDYIFVEEFTIFSSEVTEDRSDGGQIRHSIFFTSSGFTQCHIFYSSFNRLRMSKDWNIAIDEIDASFSWKNGW